MDGCREAFPSLHNTFTSARLLVELSVGTHQKSHPSRTKPLRNSRARSSSWRAHMVWNYDGIREDRDDVSIDFRFMQLVLDLAGDPEVALGSFSPGVRVGPGIRMPRLPALYKPKRRWRLPEQMDPLEYLEEHPSSESIWRRNYATLALLEEQVLEVLHEQASRDRSLFFRSKRPRRDIQLWLLLLLVQTAKRSLDGSLPAFSSMGRTAWR